MTPEPERPLWVVIAFFEKSHDPDDPPWSFSLEMLPAPLLRSDFESLIEALKLVGKLGVAAFPLPRYVMTFDGEPDLEAIAKQVRSHDPIRSVGCVEFQIKGLN